jgi:tyrosinase
MVDTSGTYGIKGLPRPKNAETRHPEGGIPYVKNLPVRYEISVLAGSTDPLLRKQWTLFVLALERFKMKPVNEKLSYFQIAGIVSGRESLT